MTTERWQYLRFVLVLVILFLCGCGPPPNNTEGKAVAGVGDGRVYEVSLPDGTRCVVWDGYYAGSIDCDFEGNR